MKALALFCAIFWLGTVAGSAAAGGSGEQSDARMRNTGRSEAEVLAVPFAEDERIRKALRIAYKVVTPDGKVPGVIAILASPVSAVETGGEEALISRLFPFAPADSEGIRKATVQIPEEIVRTWIAEKAASIEVRLQLIEGAAAKPMDSALLSLEEASIVGY